MIEENEESPVVGDTHQAETHSQEIPFPVSLEKPVPTLRPVANHLLLNYQRPEKVGLIHMAPKQAPLETIVAVVLAIGPDVKNIKAGERVLILSKALIGGVEGLLVEGRRVYLTQEQVVIAVIE